VTGTGRSVVNPGIQHTRTYWKSGFISFSGGLSFMIASDEGAGHVTRQNIVGGGGTKSMMSIRAPRVRLGMRRWTV
jgi:hypothetical protein